MKNKIFVIALLQLLAFSIYSQGPFTESKLIIQDSVNIGAELSQEFTFIGMNQEARMEEDQGLEGGNFSPGNPNCLISKDTNLRITNAFSYMVEVLKGNDVVLLNEWHSMAQNRAFFYGILDSLQQYGYNSIFMEALTPSPDDADYTQHSQTENWGYYTIENVFHQVILKLKRMNYNVYSYDNEYPRRIDTVSTNHKLYFINKSDSKWLPIQADSFLLARFFSLNDNTQRDCEQALNIYQKMTRNSIRKAFIYCGGTHYFKLNTYMGGILNHLVKEKIYCIDQMYLHEHSDTIYENPLYAKYANVNYPFVILDKQNKPIHTIHYSWRNYTSDTLIDMAIGAPRSIYINNRPTWLELNGDRKRVALSKFMDVNGTSDCLITIYELKGDKNEPSTIPEDVFQVLPYSGDYDAILTPNKKYKLVAIRNGEVIIDKLIELKE